MSKPYWIPDEDFEKSPHQMYRSFIYNFQEDMWQKIYRFRSFENPILTKATKQFEVTLQQNYLKFQQHLRNPTSEQIIESHLRLISNRLNALSAILKNAPSGMKLQVEKVRKEFT